MSVAITINTAIQPWGMMMPSAINRAGALVCWAAIAVIGMPVALAEETSVASATSLSVAGEILSIDASVSMDSVLPLPVSAHAAAGRSTTVAMLKHPSSTAGSNSALRCVEPDAQTLSAILPVATDHGSHASGVVFAHGRVLTAAHAVQGGSRFFVRVGQGFRVARLLMVDHANDLAVLAVNTESIPPIKLAPVELHQSQPVWAVGYPRAQAIMASSGVFQRNRAGALHTSASIDSGQSGGGLLSCSRGSWQLVGMLRGYGAYLSGDRYVKLENHSVSVAASTINQFLSSNL